MEGKRKTGALKVLHISPEAAPFSKVGGLADVAGSLPPALRRHSADCRLLTPAWDGVLDSIRDQGLQLTRLSRKAEAVIRWRIYRATVWKCVADGLPVYLLDAPDLFGNTIYPRDLDPDTAIPFLFLSLAALDLPETALWKPEIIHCHDWATAPLPAALQWHRYFRHSRGDYRTVFTIHNLAHQGVLPLMSLEEWGIEADARHLGAMEFFGMANLMKAALVASDAITTVSPTYAGEIQTDAGGEGLAGLLRSVSFKVSGILNGIDVNYWDPESDALLPANYSAKDPAGKKICRTSLLEKAGWPDDERPIFSIVGRMVEQKGFPILIPALETLVDLGCRLFIVGSGQPEYEYACGKAAERWPDSVFVFSGYDEPLAHLAYAGGDFFLMPSRFEPCGLSQLISLRYGTIPVVRSVGGLADTVFDFGSPRGNGVVFHDYTVQALVEAVSRAITVHRDERAREELVLEGMKANYSWDRSAPIYARLYASLLQ
ncbi:glycogen synthase [Aminivibrio sp.]|jgi:starch synthase|uniref:glycogen synthase n=1 Tax=Aminivibrio sp. TaxID=1872489 RepID=UPI0016AB9313|nr:glycogen synthase [Synergistaceae bacterium]MDD4020385.1 glycogen synthase [Synergistaceae bacterium]MDD4612407.1 glycogen synthase [Synergistaceae bacterium]NCC56651.1 glycogen synthase [Synergistales bacterium]NLO59262.1 glycogen synthase [Synergistaceae bacterium]